MPDPLDDLRRACAVGLFLHPTDTAPGHFLCSGVLVADRCVLTVRHAFEGGIDWRDIFVRFPHGSAVSRLVRSPDFHPDAALDAALLSLEHQPRSARCAPRADQAREETTDLVLAGYMEGQYEAQPVQKLLRFDGEARHHVFMPKQPVGHSGSALWHGDRVVGMAIAHYRDPNIHRGCALGVEQMSALWLDGATAAAASASASTAVPVSRAVAAVGRGQAQDDSLPSRLRVLIAKELDQPHLDTAAFMRAWSADGFEPISLQDVTQGSGPPWTNADDVFDFLQHLRNTIQAMVSRMGDGLVSPQTSRLIHRLQQLAIQARLAMLLDPQALMDAKGHLCLGMEDASVAALTAGSLTHQGTMFEQRGQDRPVAVNVIEGFAAVEFMHLSAADQVKAEVDAHLQAMGETEGIPLSRRREHLREHRGGSRELPAMRAGLRSYKRQHGVGPMVGYRGSEAPAPTTDPDAQSCLAELGVPVYRYGAESGAASAGASFNWRELARTLDAELRAFWRLTAGRANRPQTSDAAVGPPSVFVCYAHADRHTLAEPVLAALASEHKRGHIRLWFDERIESGRHFTPAIQQAISEAKVAVVLVSPQLLRSDYVLQYELPALDGRERAGRLMLCPVVLDHCRHEGDRHLAGRHFPCGGDPLWTAQHCDSLKVKTFVQQVLVAAGVLSPDVSDVPP